MSIVLQSSGGGSVTVNEPSTASNFTQTLPASDGTVMVSGNMPAFSAIPNGTSQTLASSTQTVLQFQTKEYDTNNCYNNTGSTATLNGLSVPAWAFCPNVAGYYRVTGAVQINSSNTGITLGVEKNGSLFKNFQFLNGASIGGTGGSAEVYLNGTGDYVRISAWIATGQGINPSGTYVYFQASMVRAA